MHFDFYIFQVHNKYGFERYLHHKRFRLHIFHIIGKHQSHISVKFLFGRVPDIFVSQNITSNNQHNGTSNNVSILHIIAMSTNVSLVVGMRGS